MSLLSPVTQDPHVSSVQCASGIPPGIWGLVLTERISSLVPRPHPETMRKQGGGLHTHTAIGILKEKLLPTQWASMLQCALPAVPRYRDECQADLGAWGPNDSVGNVLAVETGEAQFRSPSTGIKMPA